MIEDELGLHYNHQDHLGSASLITDSAGTVEQTLDYHPFESERVNETTSNFSARHTYTDQESDGVD